MLNYLVTYVRESLDRGPSSGVSAGGTASSAGTVTTPPVSSEGYTETSTPSPSGPQATGWAGTFPPTRAAAVMLLAWYTCQFCGCACLHRDRREAEVVSGRQLSLQGIDAIQRGQWDDAERLFAAALNKNQADERAHQHYAEVLHRRGDWKRAIRHQEEAVRLSGGDPNLLVELGQMYLEVGNVDAASECVGEALENHKELCCGWALQGDIYRRRGEIEAATACYHRALNQQPHYPQVQLALAALYQDSGRSRRALGTLETLASQFSPDQIPTEVAFQRALVLKSMGRYQDAAESLAILAARPEPGAEVLFHLADAQFQAGNAANARLAVQAAFAQSPTDPRIAELRDRIERHNQAMTAAVVERR